jgi:hypothetical protein
MPNSIKYNASAETLALKKGNFWIGTGDVGKGPTSTSGFYNGITPPSGGYTIYLNKSSNGPSIYVASNDSQLIDYTNRIAGTSYTTVNECLNYYITQTDKMVFNRDYDSIVTNGLLLNVDSSFSPSYPKNGTTIYDISSQGNNGSLVNGPTYNNTYGGSLSFDGTNDYIDVVGNFGTYSNYTICYLAKRDAENRMPVAGRVNTNFYWYGDNSWRYVHGGVGGEYYYDKNVSIPLGSWGYLCVVYNGSNVSIYRQGIYQGQQSTTGTADWSQGFKIGYWSALGPYAWQGNIASVQFYNRALSSTEILQNFKNSGPQTFSSCKTCKDILDNYPQLAGYDGLYWVYPGGPTTTPYQVYCDMTTDGGGWMLVSRSHPTTVNYNGENWGWKGGTIGSINDFSQAYQLGWGEIWNGNATFTSYIFGNQRTNVDNSWGPFIYKVSSIDYATFFGSDSLQAYTNSVLKSNTSVYGADWYPGMQTYNGFTTTGTNNNIYFMRDCCGFAGFGGTPTAMSTVYCGANFYYSGAWCGGSTTTGGVYDNNVYVSNGLTFGGTNQYMIMVR